MTTEKKEMPVPFLDNAYLRCPKVKIVGRFTEPGWAQDYKRHVSPISPVASPFQ